MAISTIGTNGIEDGAIVAADIASGAVTQVKVATGVAGTGPAFSAYMSGLPTVTSGAWTKLPCNTEEFDTNNNYDKDTNYRFQPTVAGYYQVNGEVDAYAAGSAITLGLIGIYKNGSMFKRGVGIGSSASINEIYTNVSSLVYLNGTTDYIELYAIYISSGTITLYGGNLYLGYFQASMVRSA